MKKLISIRGLRVLGAGVLILAVMSVASFGGSPGQPGALTARAEVLAQATSSSSGVQIQNLSADPATVVLEFYPQAGGGPITYSPPAISGGTGPNLPGNGNVTVFLPSLPETILPTGFNGSVVVSSDKPIAAIAKTNWTDKSSSSYTGFQSGGSEFFLPLIVRSFAGQSSRFTVQNTGAASTSVTVEIYKTGQTTPWFTESKTIAAGAAWTWDQSAASFGTSLGEGFLGSARVTSPGTVAAVGDVFRAGVSLNAVYGYNGFASGGTQLMAPLIRRNFANTTTGVQVQNIGANPTTVTINYRGINKQTGAAVTASDSATVPANSSVNFFSGKAFKNGSGQLPDQFLGAATISSSSEPIVAMVNDLVEGTGSSASYNAATIAPASSASTKIVVPLVRNRHTGDLMTTGIQVANVGNTAANVSVAYTAAPGKTLSAAQTTDSMVIQPQVSGTFFQGGVYKKDGSTRLSDGFLGAAVITSDQPILAIVNDVSLANVWDAAIFNGINQ